MPRRNALHALVRGGVLERGRHVGRREQCGEVSEVEVGLDEVGERQGGGGVGDAPFEGGVEDGPGAGEVPAHGDAASDLDDGGVAAGPGGQVAQGAAAGGEQGDAQLFVGGAAGAEDGDAGLLVRGDHPHLVGAPVADRPQRVGVVPQRVGADGLQGFTVDTARTGGADGAVSPGRRGGAAPSHQPPHRRLHKLWTTSAPYEPVPHAAMKEARGNAAGAVCAPSNAPRRIHPPSGGVDPACARTPARGAEVDISWAAVHQATSTRMRPRSAPLKPLTRPQLPG